MTRTYSDDRLSITQEIAEGLKTRGFWIPAETAGPDLITAIFKAIEDQKKMILECRDALVNAQAYYTAADSKLFYGKNWTADREEISRQIRDLIEKLPKLEINCGELP